MFRIREIPGSSSILNISIWSEKLNVLGEILSPCGLPRPRLKYLEILLFLFNKVEFPTVLIYVTSEKIRKKAWGQHRRANCPWLGRLLIYISIFYLYTPFSVYKTPPLSKSTFLKSAL
jgi:hypothetical protein